jgi:predicted  nucleic acid-binding Zn-ribbon protein
MKYDSTVFLPLLRLPEHLTDSDAATTATREKKYPTKRRLPITVTPGIKELLSAKIEDSKEHAKQVEALRCENNDLKQNIEALQQQVFDMRVKTGTANPPAEKVQMIDQEVDATEGNLTEHIEQLREDMRELRVEKKRIQELVRQQEDALWVLRGASSDEKTTDCMALYLSAMQAAQDQ